MAHTENGRDDVTAPAVFTGGKEPALGKLPHKGEPAVARGGLRRKLAKSLAEGGRSIPEECVSEQMAIGQLVLDPLLFIDVLILISTSSARAIFLMAIGAARQKNSASSIRGRTGRPASLGFVLSLFGSSTSSLRNPRAEPPR